MTTNKKAWQKPELRSEEVQETLARPACSFKPPGQSGNRPPGQGGPRPPGPAFS